MMFDPRITPARPDLAAQHLKGKVEAARYVAGTELEVRDAQAPVRREPSPDAPLDTQAQARALLPEFAGDLGGAGEWNRYTISAAIDPVRAPAE